MLPEASSPARKKLLITGCGRSGTRYVVALLEKHGLDIAHEKMGGDATASWCMAVDSESTPWGPPRRLYEFEQVFHQVRHPLTVIPSALSFDERSWEYICSWIPCELDDPPLYRAASYWYHWNLHAERFAGWRYRIEDIDEVYNEMCARLGLIADRRILDRVARDTNTRSRGRLLHWYDELCARFKVYPSDTVRRWLDQSAGRPEKPKLTWKELDQFDEKLSAAIRAKALEYGYAS